MKTVIKQALILSIVVVVLAILYNHTGTIEHALNVLGEFYANQL